MLAYKYLMENEHESLRMELKSDRETIEKQALWAGVKPGMRIADIGCGPGKTSFVLNQLVQPGGEIVGIDCSEIRISHALKNYPDKGITFLCRNVLEPLDDLGRFDFIWIRFLLEYFRSESFDIVRKTADMLKPGGVLCLIDLDNNCMNHFNPPEPLEKSLHGIMQVLEAEKNFDPYAGRRLYAYLYDLGFMDIKIDVSAHHLIFGELSKLDEFNWITKVKVAAKNSGYRFEEFNGDFDLFYKAFQEFFFDPRRFTYTPAISCRGIKPFADSTG